MSKFTLLRKIASKIEVTETIEDKDDVIIFKGFEKPYDFILY